MLIMLNCVFQYVIMCSNRESLFIIDVSILLRGYGFGSASFLFFEMLL